MILPPTRRALLRGGAALTATAATGIATGMATGIATGIALPARAQGTGASRSFRIRRDGSDIGTHTLEARLSDRGFEIDIAIDIVVRIVGIPAYRYELRNTEVWSGGRLVSLDSQTNDDGDDFRVRIRAEGERLSIEGTGYSGTAPAEAATTSYYAPAFLERRPWISSQSGKVLDVSITDRGSGRHQVTGELETVLIYDGGEWVGCEFDAGGERAVYEMTDSAGSIGDLWERA